ncbi:MAG: FprA family A-type flavoprotein [Armatimonadetes bacterium]|nr:FprA family A-type flavoprotein [Armatimonadota bacterium]
MHDALRAQQITDRVWWVGAIDWDIRDFHGYMTGRGTTWNAYLILGDEPILIDTVKPSGKAEMMARIASIIDPASIRYVISNHTEMDHSGSLPDVVRAVRPAQLFASQMGAKGLPAHFDVGMEITPVKDLETLTLGGGTLTFVETRMVHWPDSMFTYFAEDQVLFSSDGFGMHLASQQRFADELPAEVLDQEAAKYFANILLLFSPQLTKLLDKVAGLNLPLKVIAPDHGPIFREGLGEVIGRYARWAEQKPTMKAVVLYDSMWDSTKLMAKAIGEGLAEGGADPRLLWARGCHRSHVMGELLDAGALLVGGPTLNNGLFPTLADHLTYMKGLRPRNLVGAAFGSYGWSGEAVKLIEETLAAMDVELVQEGLRVKWVPTADDLLRSRQLGLAVAQRMHEVCTTRNGAIHR